MIFFVALALSLLGAVFLVVSFPTIARSPQEGWVLSVVGMFFAFAGLTLALVGSFT